MFAKKKTHGAFLVPSCFCVQFIIPTNSCLLMFGFAECEIPKKLRQNGQITAQNLWLWLMSPLCRLEHHWDLEILMANFHQRCVWTRQHTWHSPRTRSICFHHRDPLGASKWTNQMLKMQRILGLKMMLNRYIIFHYIIDILIIDIIDDGT